MRIASLIPARSSSKGLPGKNLLNVFGEPLIVWTIRASLESGVIDDTLVSTEDEDIANCAMASGAGVIQRPASLSEDETPTWKVVRHAMEFLDQSAVLPDLMVLLQPTSPLRTAAHVAAAVKAYPGTGTLVSVTRNEFHPFKSLVLDAEGQPVPVGRWEDLERPRQLLPDSFRPNGAIYIVPTNQVNWPGLVEPPITLFLMDAESSVDIDTAEDLELAVRSLAKR